MPKLTFDLREIDKEDTPIVGGKAANLGELTKLGLPIPKGFTIVANAYFDFLGQSGLSKKIKDLFNKIDVNNPKLLNDTSNLIKKAINSANIPKDIDIEIRKQYRGLTEKGSGLVAVRSSATAEDLPEISFAGQQTTYLNIKGEKELLNAVKACWSSLFEARAIFYREQNKFNHLKVGMAVVVQKMVQSEVSGVMFTIDPTTNDKNKIIIEAVWGLGEIIVQGLVDPDHFEVDKRDFRITYKQIADQNKQLVKVGKQNRIIPVSKVFKSVQKLSDEKIIKLAKVGKRIENHYGFPQDIEWAVENDNLNIVQTRAVTAMEKVEEGLKKSLIEIKLPVILVGSPASPGIAVGPTKVLNSAKDIWKIKRGDILVVPKTNPDYIPAMKKAAAIVTDKEGRTSHAAIISRELGIPCVVGTKKATKLLSKNKLVVTVSGSIGKIYMGAFSPKNRAAISYEKKLPKEEFTLLNTATKVFVSLGEIGLAQEVARHHVDGIGLLRAELMIAEIGIHPRKMIADKRQKVFIEKLAEGIKIFTSAFDPRPVIYRTTDLKSSEYRNLKGAEKFEDYEENPLLGFRGALRYVYYPEVFEMELEAIKVVRNKHNLKNLWLMIPFVRTLSEIKQIKRMVAASGLHRSSSFKLLMMAEIPSNAILIDKFLDTGIDGVSIGSNDLTMLLLGIDRDNAKITDQFNELDPAVLWSIERIISECKKRKLYSGICGQAPLVYPQLTEKLVEWGISSVSVSPDAIEKTRKIVYEAEKKLVTSRKNKT